MGRLERAYNSFLEVLSSLSIEEVRMLIEEGRPKGA